MSEFSFKIETRGGTDVVVFETGCQPATHVESQLWAKVQELRESLRKDTKETVNIPVQFIKQIIEEYCEGTGPYPATISKLARMVNLIYLAGEIEVDSKPLTIAELLGRSESGERE